MALRFSFFKTPKHRVFNYTPRHYDPDKEELQERIRKAEREVGYVREEDKDKPYVPNIKGQIKRNLENLKRYSDESKQKKLRYIIAIVSMAALFAALYNLIQKIPYLFVE